MDLEKDPVAIFYMTQGAKISYAKEQLIPRATTREAVCRN